MKLNVDLENHSYPIYIERNAIQKVHEYIPVSKHLDGSPCGMVHIKESGHCSFTMLTHFSGTPVSVIIAIFLDTGIYSCTF